MYEKERPFAWFCPNCANPVGGFMNANGEIKAACSKCRTVMVRKPKKQNRDTIDLFAPMGTERI